MRAEHQAARIVASMLMLMSACAPAAGRGNVRTAPARTQWESPTTGTPRVDTAPRVPIPRCAERERMPDPAGGDPRLAALRPLPLPPQQDAPWSPPSGVDPTEASAVAQLFAEGLPDPRECEYRTVRIVVGESLESRSHIVETRGWVLPNDASGRRWVIAWNGLLYPAVAIGDSEDVADDLRADFGIPPDNGTESEPRSTVAPIGHQPIRTALLLRLGFGEAVRFPRRNGPMIAPEDDGSDPYVHLAADWLWHRFARALHAHAGGDDSLALGDFRFLAAARLVMNDRAIARCSPPVPVRNGVPLRFGFLARQLDALLADHERRASTTAPGDADTIRDARTRMAVRIEQLADADPRLVPLEDPYIRALVLEGEDAIEPLLDVYLHDERLTRAIGAWRAFVRDRWVLPVRSAALMAIEGILETEFSNTARDDASRQGVVEQVRRYRRDVGIAPERRWLRILAHDQERPEAWADAAEWLAANGSPALRSDERQHAYVPNLHVLPYPPLGTMLAERLDELDRASSARDDPRWIAAERIASALRRWDPSAASEALANHERRARALTAPGRQSVQRGVR